MPLRDYTSELNSPSFAPVLVVGASARAAVQSLARAGLQGTAIDLFADRDLVRLARTRVCPPGAYPDAFPDLAAEMPPGPVIYTGGMENHPQVVARLAEQRPLWGNPPSVLHLVRDPYLFQSLDRGPIRCAPVVPPGRPAPDSGRWLRKPLGSSAGHGIRFATPGEEPLASHYLQEFIEGGPFSALFFSSGERRFDSHHTHLLGLTAQLVGETRLLHARPFAYCGNVGPVTLSSAVDEALQRFGSGLAELTGLRGLWGLDFILKEGIVYVVEVNPRYTAGTEVLELGASFSAMTLHRGPFSQAGEEPMVWRLPLPPPQGRLPYPERTVGKAIYYAPRRIVFPPHGPWDADLESPFDPWRVPGFADIPEPETAIESGSPVLTVFATGSSVYDCLGGIKMSVEELELLFSKDSR